MSEKPERGPRPLREALREALATARKERNDTATSALRSALSAIDNATAVHALEHRAGAIEQAPVGVGATEVTGRDLTESEVRRLVQAEIDEQLSAAAQFGTTHAERAGELRDQAEVLQRILASSPRTDEVETFWREAVRHTRFEGIPGYLPGSTLGVIPPPSWSFGGTAHQADELLELVLAGTKTATASSWWDYEAEGEPLPEVGTLGIVLDSAGLPRALLATTQIDVVPFAEVSAEHAHLEGEGDRSLAHWREVHERFFKEFRSHDREFSFDMPVVCERFVVLHSV